MKSIEISNVVSSVMRNYDQDKNGIIEVNKNNNLSEGVWKNDRYIENRPLFNVIDIHTNQDGKVTEQELFYFVKTYDRNNDGKLDQRSFFDRLFKKPMGELDELQTEFKGIELKKGFISSNNKNIFQKIFSWFLR